jgi:outer membrane protein
LTEVNSLLTAIHYCVVCNNDYQKGMKTMLNKSALIAVSAMVATMSWTAPTMAYEQGDWIVRAGATMVDPDTDSDKIDVAGLATLDGVDIDDDTQFGITGTYMLTDILGIELLAATPFEHDITVNGVGINAGSAKQLPPTVTVMWYPLGNSSSAWQPYIGAGVNYTYFWDETVDKELEAALGIITEPVTGTTDPVPANLDLDDSWGLAAHAGVDYLINDNWGINASVWYIDIDTEATIETSLADVKFDVDIDPWVYMVGISYKF